MFVEPTTMDKTRTTPRHTIIKFQRARDTGNTLQTPRGKNEVSYKVSRSGMVSDFSIATYELENSIIMPL